MQKHHVEAPTFPGAALHAPKVFPANFVWGVGSSAYQNEVSSTADGKSPSIWDVFCDRDGANPDGSSGAVACDSYRRYADDTALITAAGLSAYRFSVAWTRILPEGAGTASAAGIDYYDRLIDAALAAGVEPYITAYHWDLPQCLQDRGGWANREIVSRFADYFAVLVGRFGDRVKHWFVLNEPNIHALMGHLFGKNAPGIADLATFRSATHHQNIATGAAIAAARAIRGDLSLGTVISLQQTPPATASEQDRIASIEMDEIINRAYLDPLMLGTYPARIEQQFSDAGLIQPGDMALAHQGLDMLGVNYYADFYTKMGAGGPEIDLAGGPPNLPKTPTGYSITDQGLYRILADLRDNYGNPIVHISENGMADLLDGNGQPVIDDIDRVEYLRRHLFQLSHAIADGCDVRSYFAWTLVDNFEWEWGFEQRYGLVALDRATGERTPKKSYYFYADVARSNRLNPAIALPGDL